MTTKKIILDFAEWMKKSQGRPITFPGGAQYYFWTEKIFDATELASVESTWSISLPGDYRNFLIQVGAGKFFFEKDRAKGVPKSGIEFRRIDHICVAIAASAEGPNDRIFANYLPIGVDRRQQSMLILGVEGEAPLYSAKKVPEHWNELRLSEPDCLGTFTEWLQKVAESYLAPIRS